MNDELRPLRRRLKWGAIDWTCVIMLGGPFVLLIIVLLAYGPEAWGWNLP